MYFAIEKIRSLVFTHLPCLFSTITTHDYYAESKGKANHADQDLKISSARVSYLHLSTYSKSYL